MTRAQIKLVPLVEGASDELTEALDDGDIVGVHYCAYLDTSQMTAVPVLVLIKETVTEQDKEDMAEQALQDMNDAAEQALQYMNDAAEEFGLYE